MKFDSTILFVLASLAMFLSCDTAFNPDGPYKEQLVVYALFSTRSDTQYVRVSTTYQTQGTSGGAPDAQVTIHQGNAIFAFRDTLIDRTDTTRLTSKIRAYVSYGLHLEAGFRYDLSVMQSSLGSVSSHATSLYRGTLVTETNSVGNVSARVFPGVNARAFVLRMYIEYSVLRDSVLTTMRAEVPQYVDGAGEAVYPSPLPRDRAIVVFERPGFNATVSRLRLEHSPGTVRLLRTVFVLTQLDDWLHAYYSTVNGFPDSGTLRLDEPDFTNIVGGLGVFGMSSETVVTADTTGNM